MRSNPVPRWSVVMPPGISKLLPASRAELPATRAWVCVVPPLSARVVSIKVPTATPVISLPKPTLPVVLPIALKPLLVKVPLTSGLLGAAFPATIVLRRLAALPLLLSLKIPPASDELPVEVLLAIVLLVTFNTLKPRTAIPPPAPVPPPGTEADVLPEIVLLVMFTV